MKQNKLNLILIFVLFLIATILISVKINPHTIPDEQTSEIIRTHTPEEIRFLSNFAHWVEGFLLAIVSILSFLEFNGRVKGKLRYIWPSIIVFSGLFLLFYIFGHHGLSEIPQVWNYVTNDVQQMQHLTIAIILTLFGTVELLNRMNVLKGKYWEVFWPIGLISVGFIFLYHEQLGTHEAISWASTIHMYLGIVLMLSGLLKALEIFTDKKYKWITVGWIFLLLITSMLLIAYREPEGAYETIETDNEYEMTMHSTVVYFFIDDPERSVSYFIENSI